MCRIHAIVLIMAAPYSEVAEFLVLKLLSCCVNEWVLLSLLIL